MRFARRLVLLPLLSLLAACSPTTPLFVAQVTTGEVAEYKQMKSNRMTAAIEEEGDLLTYSAMAIRDNRSAEAEKLYLTGYDNRRYSAEVRGISLYQIGLIYMSRYNDQRDDAKATDYFQRVVREFPGTHAAEHAQARLLAMRQRAREPVQKSARELLATWKPQQNLDLYKTSLDPDMTLLSRRAVLKDRVDEAAELYLLAVNDPAIPAGITARAGVALIDQTTVADHHYRVGADAFTTNIVATTEGIALECLQRRPRGLLGTGPVGVGPVFGQGREGEYQGQRGEGAAGQRQSGHRRALSTVEGQP